MYPDKTLSNVFDHRLPSPSPSIPDTPAPAYSALPYRDVEFHFAPLLNDKLGEIELETVDGKRFLVHKKILEAETVFFHIYYGFVPVWRLNGSTSASASSPPLAPHSTLNNLLCLPKMFAHHLSRASAASSTPQPLAPEQGPPVPPKDVVSAPTPTTSPFIWVVPETSTILEAFLSLIYPRGTLSDSPEPVSRLCTLDLTGRVIRAALGYQSTKAINVARDHLISFIEHQPVEVYAMASFFKFTDLAKLASGYALRVSSASWPIDSKLLMGKTATSRLQRLQEARIDGLNGILSKPVEVDTHSEMCVRRSMMEQVWEQKKRSLGQTLQPDSELVELLDIDLRGGHCGECLVLLASTLQRCLYEARELPRTI
ncbi:hypothetical protein P7C73_g3787, partial [Tremellales sp. Uapishka_1]